MLVTVTGGSGSGKSEFAENLLLRLDGDGPPNRIYVATMEPYGEEGRRRIKRHRALRQGKGFETVECCRDLKSLVLAAKNGKRPSVLLECMSNLAANELYGGLSEEDGGAVKDGPEQGFLRAKQEILAGIQGILSQAERLVVVTGEVFSDGLSYDPSTEQYRRLLGEVNRELSARSDVFAEVVCSLPLYLKGGPL